MSNNNISLALLIREQIEIGNSRAVIVVELNNSNIRTTSGNEWTYKSLDNFISKQYEKSLAMYDEIQKTAEEIQK